MKKLSILALVSTLMLAACKENKTDTATTSTEQNVAEQKGETFNVDTEGSVVKWTAYHKGGLNPRFGIMKTTGNLSVENGNLTAGTLNSDVNTLLTDPTAVDPKLSDGKTSIDLDNHLKSPDFFDVSKYPSVKFEITKIEELPQNSPKSQVEGANKQVSGNLTIKGKTVNVTFPAKVDIKENQVSLTSKFTINRADWGLAYGTEGDPKDWMISKDVDLDLNIIANK